MTALLTAADGHPVVEENLSASGPILLICEHASRLLPMQAGDLGLSAEARDSHIAWDPGALAVSHQLAELLDATLISQRFSRLIYDCNRPPEAEAAMPATSEIFAVPGNAQLSAEDRARRTREVYLPFRDRIAGFITERVAAARPPLLVTMHSFTPVYHGQARSVELGILHDTDSRLADAMLVAAGSTPPFAVRRNEPYGPADGVTHTLKEHGLKNGLFNVMIEIRNDLIQEEAGQKVMAVYLAGLLGKSLVSLSER